MCLFKFLIKAYIDTLFCMHVGKPFCNVWSNTMKAEIILFSSSMLMVQHMWSVCLFGSATIDVDLQMRCTMEVILLRTCVIQRKFMVESLHLQKLHLWHNGTLEIFLIRTFIWLWVDLLPMFVLWYLVIAARSMGSVFEFLYSLVHDMECPKRCPLLV